MPSVSSVSKFSAARISEQDLRRVARLCLADDQHSSRCRRRRRRGRIYLPIEDLRKFEVSESSLLAGKPSGNFTALMRFEAGRARALLPTLATLFRTTTQTLSNPPNLCAQSMSASSRDGGGQLSRLREALSAVSSRKALRLSLLPVLALSFATSSAWELSDRASQHGGAKSAAGVWQCFDDQQIGCEPLNHLTQGVSGIRCDNARFDSTPESKSGAETSSSQTSKSCAASPRDAAIAAAKGVSVTAIVACSGRRSSNDLCRNVTRSRPAPRRIPLDARCLENRAAGEQGEDHKGRHASARELHCW